MKMITISFAAIIGLFGIIEVKASPTPTGETQKQAPEPLIYFDKGRVGVNFFGFKAAAGLGSILTGNQADGGLYAEAGTPFGQFAHAGLGGQVDEQGKSMGGLFAGATAGNGIGAKAGLGGRAGADGSFGSSYAGASAGGLTKLKFNNIGVPAGGVVDDRKDNIGELGNIQIVSSKDKLKNAEVIDNRKVDGPLTALDIDVRRGEIIPVIPPEPIYIEKTKFKTRRRPHLKRKQIFVSRGGYYGGLDSLPGPPIAPIPGPDFGDVPVVNGGGGVAATKTVSVRKSVNPQFINDVFNIPISTLNAVSRLVGGIAKNVEGSVTVSKAVAVNKDSTKN